MSVMEMSHRGKEFMGIASEAESNLRELLAIPADYKVLFSQGGATLQFASIPLNMLGTKGKADYMVSGQWSEKAAKECNKYGKGNVVFTTKESKFTKWPKEEEWTLDPEAAYVHYCMNETVNGVEYQVLPKVGEVPLVGDMSSNFLSRPVDVSAHKVIYAGLQKNAGPAGMAVNIVHPDFVSGTHELGICPTYCSWKTLAGAESMYNTPACFTWYVMGEYLKHSKKLGGVAYWEEQALKKSGHLYDIIDGSDKFYSNPVEMDVRSRMNIPFLIKGGDEALEKTFLVEAKKEKLFQLAGHRSVGGLRASVYNGMPFEGVVALGDFMKKFMDEHRE